MSTRLNGRPRGKESSVVEPLSEDVDLHGLLRHALEGSLHCCRVERHENRIVPALQQLQFHI